MKKRGSISHAWLNAPAPDRDKAHVGRRTFRTGWVSVSECSYSSNGGYVVLGLAFPSSTL